MYLVLAVVTGRARPGSILMHMGITGDVSVKGDICILRCYADHGRTGGLDVLINNA